MEKWLIVGIEFNAEFRSNGVSKPGITLHLIRDSIPGTGVSGQETRKQFLGNDTCSRFKFAPATGYFVVFDFDRNGLCRLELEEASA